MKLKIKKLNKDAVIPTYSRQGDAGMDLTATSMHYDEYGNAVYGTGIAIEIPTGYVGFLFPRSSISKMDLSLSNAVGIIDSGYRGEIIFKFKPTLVYSGNVEKSEPTSYYDYVDIPSGEYYKERVRLMENNAYTTGDRIGQIIILPYPEIEFEETDELSNTERGSGGYGSTGK